MFALSVTKAEGADGVMVAQDMLYIYRIVTLINVQVQLSMVLEIDSRGAVDSWISTQLEYRLMESSYQHMWNHFLRGLKNPNLLAIMYVPCAKNDVEIFTKNTATTFLGSIFISSSGMASTWLLSLEQGRFQILVLTHGPVICRPYMIRNHILLIGVLCRG